MTTKTSKTKTANATADAMSIRIRARDRMHQGRTVEVWIRCASLERIIERAKPSRQGINHDRYGIVIAMLCHEGIARPLPNGASGYQWTDAYKRIGAREKWLTAYAKQKGEVRKRDG